MSPGSGAFVIILALIGTFGWLTSLYMSHRAQARRSSDTLGADRKVELVSAENAHLKGQVGRLEERLAVLERIATDPAERTAREIESLRREVQ